MWRVEKTGYQVEISYAPFDGVPACQLLLIGLFWSWTYSLQVALPLPPPPPPLSSSSSSFPLLEVMSRPLTQLLPPDLPAGATSPQFGASNPTGSGPQGGHLTSMTNLKSLLQLPIKADQRGTKDCCEMKGECVHVRVCVCARVWERWIL